MAFEVAGDRVILPKPGDLVELLYAMTAWARGTNDSPIRIPKGKTGLVIERDGVISWVLIDGQEYDIMDSDLEVIGEASE